MASGGARGGRGKSDKQRRSASDAKAPLSQRRELFHGIVYGDFGEGKSDCLAHILPKPLVVLFFDTRGKETPYLNMGRPLPVKRTKAGVLYREVLHKERDELIIRVEYYAAPDIQNPGVFSQFLDRVSMLERQLHKYRSCALDSSSFGTLLARKFSQYDQNPDANDGRQHYGFAAEIMEEVLCCQLPQLSMNVGVASHVSREKIKVGDSKVGMPLMPGRVQEMIGMAWPEMYRIYIEPGVPRGEDPPRHLQTVADERWCAATQIKAPNGTNARSWKKLWVNWDKRERQVERRAGRKVA